MNRAVGFFLQIHSETIEIYDSSDKGFDNYILVILIKESMIIFINCG